MNPQPTTGHEPAGGSRTARPSRNDAQYLLVGLLALSVLVAYVVLQAMAASSAAATGGCGGG